MQINHHLFGQLSFKLHRVISMPLALCSALLLAACGSGDDFPGGTENQDPDPLVTDVAMFYIERPLRESEDTPGTVEEDNLRDPLAFHGSAHLYMKVRASQSAPSIDLSARAVAGNVDVRDLDVSHDGRYVLFSLRGPGDPDDDEEDLPSWNIWIYDIQNDSLRPVINDVNRDNQGHDIMPRFLADGRIIFASTRQQKSRATLTDEAKGAAPFSHLEESRRQPALNLHVMNADGTCLQPPKQCIEQVTFNQSHDMYPVVMSNGKVVYSRWDQFDGREQGINLYEMNPDGSGNHLLYGRHSHTTGNNASELQFVRGNLMPNGDLFVLARPNATRFYGGDFLRINTAQYVDNSQPIAGFSGSGPAQTTITNKLILTNGSISPGGFFSAFFPMWDNTNRALVSWSQCRVQSGNSTTLPCTTENLSLPGVQAAPPAYGLWIYNYVDNTQIPVVIAREGVVYSDVALGAARTRPAIVHDGSTLPADDTAEGDLDTRGEAVIHIRSVYDFDGTSRNFGGVTPAYLRVMKAVPEPPRNEEGAIHSINDNGGTRMREVVGYAPIQPDGSIKTRVPANVALTLSIVDADGKELLLGGSTRIRHQNWITLRPREVLECNGCHVPNSTQPHGRINAQRPSIITGVTTAEATILKLSTDLLYGGADSMLPTGLVDPSERLCLLAWTSGCPIIINYEDHIQPIWELDRGTLTPAILAEQHDDGNSLTLLPPATCTDCHSRVNPADSTPQVPAGQLELTNEVDGASVQNRAFVELFNADIPQLLDGGVIVDCTQDVPRLDDEGNPVLDENDVPIIDTIACPASEGPYLSGNGARAGASPAFFALFETGSHAGYLTPAELRLIAEWLDIGGQYYNNHFDAPDAN